MRFKFLFLLTSIVSFISFSSCKKVAGNGGLASIQGKVYAIDYDKNGLLKSEGYLGDQRVSLSFGDNTTVDIETRTSYTGEYEFDFLQKGNYTVFTYSPCDTCVLSQRNVIQKVTINEKKEVVTVDDLLITQ